MQTYQLLARSIFYYFLWFFVMHVFESVSYFRIFPSQTGNATDAIESKSSIKQPDLSSSTQFLFRPSQSRSSRDPIFCDTKIERAGGREVVSRSVFPNCISWILKWHFSNVSCKMCLSDIVICPDRGAPGIKGPQRRRRDPASRGWSRGRQGRPRTMITRPI